jgi:hypothetical protein
LSSLGSGCSVRNWRTIRLVGANGPRSSVFVQFVTYSCESWLDASSLLVSVPRGLADAPQVRYGWSVFCGVLLEVRELFSDGPP